MLKSAFIDIFKTFSNDELKKFRDFLRSPYHNKNKNVIKLFEYLRKYIPEINNDGVIKGLTKEKIFSLLYPGKKYNDIVMRILLSDLKKLSEEFLAVQELNENAADEYKFLLRQLNKRRIDNIYNRVYNAGYKSVQNHKDLRTKYLKLFEYETSFIDHHLERNREQFITGNVLSRSEYLICFFILELSGNIHDLVINERTYNAKFSFTMAYEFINRFDFEGFLEKLKQAGSGYYTTMQIYIYLILAVVNEKEDEIYYKFKNTVIANYDKLTKNETYNLLNNLETCCLNRRKYNQQKYEDECYQIYRIMLDKSNYSYYGNEMGFQRFKNIMANLINLNKISEAEKFVNEYINAVSQSIRENLFLFSMALIEFYKKNYTNSLTLIQKIKIDQFVLKYDVKNLTLRIYYELGYWENAFSVIDTYRHFLFNNKSVSDFYRERYLNFISFINSLIKCRNGGGRFEAEKMRNDLLKTQNILNREWILEKISELSAD